MLFKHYSIVLIVLFAWGSTARSVPATFIAPASPTVVTKSTSNSRIPVKYSPGYGTSSTSYPSSYSSSSSSSSLYAKKKNKNAPAATKKVQVKLLKHVAGSGQAGDVIQVTPAFFNNKLRPNKSAEIISDEQVAEEQSQAEEDERNKASKASELQERLSDMVVTIKRKAGPDGQLFGGIGPKVIMEEVQNEVQDEFLNEKWVKVTEISDENGKKMRGDIKHTGQFGARIALLSDVSAKFSLMVEAE